mmetsp:Transcript_18314/g.58487  ORF Transcript_18314/g.58487 Transcript_18314/m.58487 type:complete len:271 (-) Transcript_18314:279-1091(-)
MLGKVLLEVMSIQLLGFLLKRSGAVTPVTGAGIGHYVAAIGFPCVLFSALAELQPAAGILPLLLVIGSAKALVFGAAYLIGSRSASRAGGAPQTATTSGSASRSSASSSPAASTRSTSSPRCRPCSSTRSRTSSSASAARGAASQPSGRPSPPPCAPCSWASDRTCSSSRSSPASRTASSSRRRCRGLHPTPSSYSAGPFSRSSTSLAASASSAPSTLSPRCLPRCCLSPWSPSRASVYRWPPSSRCAGSSPTATTSCSTPCCRAPTRHS